MERSVAEFSARLTNEAKSGNLNVALGKIVEFVRQIVFRQSSLGKVFSSPHLDGLCALIGTLAREGAAPARVPVGDPRQDHVVYLATQLARIGGHTRVLAGLVSAERVDRHTILISDIDGTTVGRDLTSLFPGLKVDIRVAPPGDLLSRTRWLQQNLAAIRPRRTYLLNHHYDATAIAAAEPDLVGRLIYIHHCDHALALGVHVPHARHVDLHAKGFYNCCEQEGVSGNVIWPLVAAGHGHRAERRFLARGHLTTCTAGGPEKFQFSHGFEQVPYLCRYDETVPLIVDASGGTHIHIGALSAAMLDNIRQGLTRSGVPAERFVHIPFVPSLWSALLEQRVDVYVGSFPFGGGRTVVEAMGAGLPLILHSNYRSGFFTDMDVYNGAMTWRYPSELAAWLSKLDSGQLTHHAARSRAYYEAHHRPELLRAAIDLEISGGEPPRPTRPAHVTDRLQVYLDDYHAFWTRSGREIVLTDEERDDVDEKWRREVERVREETIRFMTIPVRTCRVLARMLAKLKSLLIWTRSG